MKYWITNFKSGVDSEREIASSFIRSNEFLEEYGRDISNNEFVKALYENVLKREPDINGLKYWTGQLNNGIEARNEILLGFAESNENKLYFIETTLFG